MKIPGVFCLSLPPVWLLQLNEWSEEKIDMEQRSQEKLSQLQQTVRGLQTDRRRLQDSVVSSARCLGRSVFVQSHHFPSSLPVTGRPGPAQDGGRSRHETTGTGTTAVQGNNA